ncbi:MAG: hypothetical protein BMS9Abin37_1450 [Acidobacteriota bacterium]|nr:MAG: hypothetical protein BMS9Abin37_1450 [Acidobacteriota bacterium]
MQLSSLLLLLAYVTTFLSVSLVIYLMLPDFRRRAALARLGAAEGRESVDSPLLQLMHPMLRAIAPWVAHYKLTSYRASKEKQIAGAGLKEELRVEELIEWKIVLEIIGKMKMELMLK